MRNYLKRTTSAAFAVSLLGYAVIVSVGMAEPPCDTTTCASQQSRSRAPAEKAPSLEAWLSENLAQPRAPSPPAVPHAQTTAFDWALESTTPCAKCAKKDSQVTPVVLDLPDNACSGDTSAIENPRVNITGSVMRASGNSV